MSKPEEEVQGACPFCKAALSVDWERGILSHALPTCERFKTLTADEFVATVLNGEHKS